MQSLCVKDVEDDGSGRDRASRRRSRGCGMGDGERGEVVMMLGKQQQQQQLVWRRHRAAGASSSKRQGGRAQAVRPTGNYERQASDEPKEPPGSPRETRPPAAADGAECSSARWTD